MNKISEHIFGAAVEVHQAPGPALFESWHEECPCHELKLRAVPFEPQRPLPVEYKGINLECGYRPDLLVAYAVVVEIRAIGAIEPIHEAQLLTHLRPGGWKTRPAHPLQRTGPQGRHPQESFMMFSLCSLCLCGELAVRPWNPGRGPNAQH
jgi:GxxExxY protein